MLNHKKVSELLSDFIISFFSPSLKIITGVFFMYNFLYSFLVIFM